MHTLTKHERNRMFDYSLFIITRQWPLVKSLSNKFSKNIFNSPYIYLFIVIKCLLCYRMLCDKIDFSNIEGGSVLESGYKSEGAVSRSERVGQVISTMQKQKRYRKIRFRDSFWEYLCLAWTANCYICSLSYYSVSSTRRDRPTIFVYAFCWPIANVAATQFVAQPLIAFPVFSLFHLWRQHWPCLAGWTCTKNAFYLRRRMIRLEYTSHAKVVYESEHKSRMWEMIYVR